MKHLLSIEKLPRADVDLILKSARVLKKQRAATLLPLTGQTWAMIFAKASTRTRVSFEWAFANWAAKSYFKRLGHSTRAGEPIKDTARVLVE